MYVSRLEKKTTTTESRVAEEQRNHQWTNSLLAAGFFSKGLLDERLVIANANSGVGRVKKKARQSFNPNIVSPHNPC